MARSAAPTTGPALDVEPSCATRRRGSSCAPGPAASARPPCRGPRAARRRVRSARGGADHRPGPQAGPVAGPDRAGQHPQAGGRGRHLGGRQPRRDDARHEAHLRRGGRGARRPRQGAADPRQPLLPGGLELLRWHAGVHGHGEAGPAPGQGRQRAHLGPDRRRHPAVPVGPGLPRRPQAPRLLPRRPVHPPAHGPGQGRRTGLPQGVQLRRHDGDHGDVQNPRRAGAPGRPDLRRRPGHDVRGVPGARRQDLRAAEEPETAFVVVAAPERDALREASFFVDRLDEEGMPLAGSSSTASSGWPPRP